jgi:hypothetical protein
LEHILSTVAKDNLPQAALAGIAVTTDLNPHNNFLK